MKLQIRDRRDPFTQALSLLFRDEVDVVALKRKLREKLIPLVTQVAIKIGGIDTEKSVRDRALAVFTGTISLHLAHSTIGKEGELVSEWARMVSETDLMLLFRKGYTLINELITIDENQDSFGDWFSKVRMRALTASGFTRVQHLEKYATKKDETGMWAGYLGLKDLFETRKQFEYSLWLIHQAKAEQSVIDNRTLYMDPETVVNRIIINVFLSGKVSLAMDFRKVMRVIDNAHGKKRWMSEAKKRYELFLLTVPEKFRTELSTEGSNLRRSQGHFWEMVEGWPARNLSRQEAIDSLCIQVAIPPPGLEGVMFDQSRNKLKGYEIN